tara:strand:- start:206 stop:619 length:414 start_codon:yes stop_codon:yes gene_type:complete
MELLKKEISELEMNIRVHNAFLLHAPEIKTIKDLVLSTEGQLLRMPGFGKKSLNEVRYVLKENGLSLSMKQEDLPKDMDDISKEFTYNIIKHALDASKQSLDVITEKKEWHKPDIDTYFDAHEKIMFAYRESLHRLF